MDSPDPFAPGFSADAFQGIPNRTLPDDCMEYALFVPSLAADPSAAKARLETIEPLANELAATWSEGYIWQREGFALQLAERQGAWCLQGRTEYGDAVDDEWFVVWMLRELSARFGDLWIRVYDTDGEFLLIEAANALPKWLNPEIADHRVWINSARLLIIPLSASPAVPPAASPAVPLSVPPAVPPSASTSSASTRTAPISRPLTLADALTTLHTYTTSSTPPPALLTHIRLVQEESFYRTTRYPSAATHNAHHALTTLPRLLAHLLHTHPSAIAAAVEAFYLRDPISLKALTPMTHFPPTDPVTVSTKFTKTLYAQLKAQDFQPPPSAGFPHPTATNNAIDMGTKLTCGFEMLLSDATAPQLSSPSRQRTVATIRAFLATPPGPPPTDAEMAAWPKRQDSEQWLDVDYAQFEQTLQGQPGHRGTQNESGWGDKGAEENLKRMVERFEAFLNDDRAGVEGVEMGDEMDVDDDDDDDDDSELGSGDDEEGEEDREVSFDEREFERMMREMMGMPVSTLERERGAEGGEAGEAEDEEAEIRKVMRQVEAELREAGALETPLPKQQRIKEVDEDEDEDGELDIDYTLAANMLESFKGQGGLAGPGGNLLARMGVGLPPRDEGDDEKGRGSREVGGERMR